MQEDNVVAISGIGPDLLLEPHVVSLLMEMIAGDKQQALSQQEQLVSHLLTCHYCRTAAIVLLGFVQEYDRRNNDAEKPSRDLLVNIAHISREIDAKEAKEAKEYERLSAYAETVVYEEQTVAGQRFPDVAAHLKICADCTTIAKMTIAAIRESEEC